MASELKNPPLIEAIIEIKWKLEKPSPDTLVDPGYKLASGRLYDRVKDKFGFIQTLPITSIPDEITPYLVRHQFRVSDNNWPLVQFGPGIASINYTSPYSWEDFQETIKYFFPLLLDAYSDLNPEKGKDLLKINSVVLRYVNGLEWNWLENDTLPFLSEKLHTKFSFPEGISQEKEIDGTPININLRLGYPIKEPKGFAEVRISTGTIGQKKGLIWELFFISRNDEAPQISDMGNFIIWSTKAHDLIEKWFKELTEGELSAQFNGIAR